MPTEVIDLCPESGEDATAGNAGGAGGGGGATSNPALEGCKEANHRLDGAVLDALRDNLDALGYREIEDTVSETPDLALLVGVVARNNWFVTSGSPYCYPSYYYSGCWYPNYNYAYNLPTNAFLVDMVDVSESVDGELSSVWTAILQGLQEKSSEKTDVQRVNEAMARAFKQSPYLKDGGSN